MKRFVLIITCFIPFYFYGQKDLLKDGIKEGLESYIEVLKEYKNRGIINSNDYFKKLRVCIDNYPPHYTFLDTISGMPINYISLKNCSVYEKILKAGVWVIILNSLTLEKNNLIIKFDLKKATLKKKKHLYLGISDWATFIFEYSCTKEQWVLIDSKFSGI
jgi:hypothetical protein